MAAALVLLLAVLAPGTARADQVPLLAWSSRSKLWPPATVGSEGHVVTEPQLQALLGPALDQGPHNVLLFLQEKLSVEDFTAYGGVYGNKPDSAFPNLEGALSDAGSALVLPAVAGEAAGAVPLLLQEHLGAGPLHVDPPTLRQLRLNASVPALLLVRLPYATGSSLMAPKEVLTGNDEVIGQVLSALKEEDVPYMALLTAPRPSRVLREVLGTVPGPLGRQLLETGPEPVHPPLQFPSGAFPLLLFWARNLSVARDGVWWDLTDATFGSHATVNLSRSSWGPTEARLVLSYKEVFNSSLTITFHMTNKWFPVSGRNWSSLEWVEMVEGGAAAPVTFNASGASVPALYSWRCGLLGTMGLLTPRTRPDPAAAHWQLLLHDIQLQAFNVTGRRFSYASDCAGFFSAPVWMGLLPGALLAAVLAYGLHMLLGLRAMDRFDDPKGPSIAVPQTE
ncbi:V-type proton ATPase subunit S1 isoform X1 [Alligator mississippiensis]|uniref:V-type proton ATPase subunit S1 isoform X1 n=1 Tax=Alligator mississippiensis TaxID=8496 RepID=UPI0003D0737C|nr:V-type proton ATPase subunit S1 isoform X1 [Alligator mississippiensis]